MTRSYSHLLPQDDGAVGVYIHVPFCKIRCSYCDFATDLEKSGDRNRYFDTLEREFSLRLSDCKIPLDTIYLGGGTPSLLEVDDLRRLVRLIENYFEISHLKEFTIEANPGGVCQEVLESWRSVGIDRVSLGVQSFIAEELKVLGRAHLNEHNHAALKALSRSKMRFNTDLMIGTPNQTLESVVSNLETVIDYGCRHISVYMLSVESEAPWFESIQKGIIKVCEDSEVAEMYRKIIETCTRNGIYQYEISAFSEHGEESKHNLKYWMNETTLGFGPSAASYSGGYRYQNWRSLKAWQQQWFSDGSFMQFERIHSKNAILDTFMLQFRLVCGVAVKELNSAHYSYPELEIDKRINRLISKGLLKLCESGQRIFLSEEGKLFANEVFLEFVD